jgi:hypothetical protein
VPGPKGLVESTIMRIVQRKLPIFYKLSIITVKTKIMVEISQKNLYIQILKILTNLSS